ncbi:MAG: heavy metal translocating P-type ATPase [Candidatus Coproplasma sp.]
MVKDYDITGMTCSACSSGIERSVKKLKGVKSASVSLMAKSMHVEFDENQLSEHSIFECVEGLGYGIFQSGETPAKAKDNEEKNLFLRFIISVCLLVPIMFLAMALPHIVELGTNLKWSALAQCILALAVLIVNYKYFTRGFFALIKKVPNMDTLVSLGTGVSFIYSLVITILLFVGVKLEGYHLYFESSAMIPALVDVGKWLEEKSKKKTGDEIEKLLRLAPDTVTVEVDGERVKVPAKNVKFGDIVVVMEGDYIPVDGVVEEGHAFVDKSAITGESVPVEVSEGDTVTTASVNVGGVIKVRACKVGGDTTLAQIIKMVRQAGASKPPIQKFADRVAGIFVPVVTAIALLTFVVWMLIDGGINPDHCVNYAIAVLVVSCPCALGLATPVAVMTATGKGASLGVLFKSAEALQKTREINCVLLDKTSTITEGRPQVSDFLTFGIEREKALSIAGGIEKNSNHPLAKCIYAYCGGGAEVEQFAYTVGKGASAVCKGVKYRLGNSALISDIKISSEVKRSAERLSSQGKTVTYLADNKRVLAIFALSDKVKDSSAEAISLFKKRNLKIAMLTGDSEQTAKAVAKSVGIDDYVAGVLPEDKLRLVEKMQSVGATVAMVGDGINDSPALKSADVGVAIGNGTDVAIDSAGVVLVSGDLRALDTAIDLSRATVRNIKQNLFWAFIYNITMIPVSAGVLTPLNFTFNPMLGALCMCLSSLFVVGNALRLLRYKNKNLSHASGENKEVATAVENTDKNNQEKEEESSMKKIVSIDGMCCEHCAKRVEKVLSAVSGVVSADVKLKKKIAVIRSREEISDEEIKKAVTEAGYTVTGIESK